MAHETDEYIRAALLGLIIRMDGNEELIPSHLDFYAGNAGESEDPKEFASQAEITSALLLLEQEGALEVVRDKYTAPRVMANKNAAVEILRLNASESDGIVSKYIRFGPDWFREALRNIHSGSEQSSTDLFGSESVSDTAPAADRTVKLSDNSDGFEEFKQNLDDLRGALSKHSADTNLSSEEINRLEGQLDAAIRMVQAAPVIHESALRAVVQIPVLYISERISSGLIGALALKILEFLTGVGL